jgi:tyrosinase
MIGGDPAALEVAGQLSYLPTGSYDPVFWLLHCNVDRLLAMWQTIHPGQWGAAQTAPAGSRSWTIAAGSQQNVDSPLTPFYRDNNSNFWTTRQVRDWAATFRYTYSDFASGSSRQAIMNRINSLYGPNANRVAGSTKRQAADASADIFAFAGISTYTSAEISGSADVSVSSPFAARNGSYYVYDANIQAPRYALNGPYSIYVFPGKPASEDPETWVFDPSLIGTIGITAAPGMSSMETIISGSIPLTRTLQGLVSNAAFDLNNLSPTDVLPYLRKNMQWRVASSCGSGGIDPSTLKGFSITVVSSSAAEVSGDVLPVFSDFVAHLSVTEGQAGGTNSTADLVGDQTTETLSM